MTNQQQEPDVQSAITMGTATVNQNQRADAESAGSAMTRRCLMAITTSNRTQSRSVMQVRQEDNICNSTCELDSHADTCIAGPNCRVLEYTGYTVNVSGFSDKLHGPIENVPIVKAATAYDDPVTGVTYILVLGQSIYLGNDVQHTLLCPNQLRYNGVTVDDCPKHLAPKDNPSTHSIFIPEQQVRVPLRLLGTMSVFDTRTPSKEEIDTCQWIILTIDEPWDPKSERFNEEEEKVEYLCQHTIKQDDRHIMSLSRNLINTSYVQQHRRTSDTISK